MKNFISSYESRIFDSYVKNKNIFLLSFFIYCDNTYSEAQFGTFCKVIFFMENILKFNTYDIKKFKEIKGRLLGFDFGEKRIGVAVSDIGQDIASSLVVIDNNKELFNKIDKIINEYNPSGFVIGLPKNLDGAIGTISDKVYNFGIEIHNKFNLPIAFYDERFSSKLAENILIEFDLSRNKRKKVIDKLAAAHILQNALDFLKFN